VSWSGASAEAIQGDAPNDSDRLLALGRAAALVGVAAEIQAVGGRSGQLKKMPKSRVSLASYDHTMTPSCRPHRLACIGESTARCEAPFEEERLVSDAAEGGLSKATRAVRRFTTGHA